MTDIPYYLRIRDVREFQRHYKSIYELNYTQRRAQKLVSLFPEVRNKKVLDIGCGGGFYAGEVCKRKGKYVTLVDLAHVCVKGAKSSLAENSDCVVEGVVADATYLPFMKNSFDFVLLVDVIEHVKEDGLLLQEVRRLLKDNGLLLLSTQNSTSLNYILEAPVQRYILKNRKWMGWDPTHIRFYNPKSLSQLLKNNGFLTAKSAGTYFIPYSLALWLNLIQKKLSELIYYAMISVNEKLEQSQNGLLQSFGWGLMQLCVKAAR